MEKIILISIDDGTVYDEKLVALLNRHGIPATFNLNSGLKDFVWQYEGLPVRRCDCTQVQEVYKGHEVASHTLHHPCLTELNLAALQWEIREDCKNLCAAFSLDEIGFAVPFTACGERELALLKQYARYVRLSEFKADFAPPADPWHIHGNAMLMDPTLREKLKDFAQSQLPQAVFVLCGHSYELEAHGLWEQVDSLLTEMKAIPDVRFMTTMAYVKEYLA